MFEARLCSCVTVAVLVCTPAPCGSELSPGLEDELYCDEERCLQFVADPNGFVGPRSSFWECALRTNLSLVVPVQATWGSDFGEEARAELVADGYHTDVCSTVTLTREPSGDEGAVEELYCEEGWCLRRRDPRPEGDGPVSLFGECALLTNLSWAVPVQATWETSRGEEGRADLLTHGYHRELCSAVSSTRAPSQRTAFSRPAPDDDRNHTSDDHDETSVNLFSAQAVASAPLRTSCLPSVVFAALFFSLLGETSARGLFSV